MVCSAKALRGAVLAKNVSITSKTLNEQADPLIQTCTLLLHYLEDERIPMPLRLYDISGVAPQISSNAVNQLQVKHQEITAELAHGRSLRFKFHTRSLGKIDLLNALHLQPSAFSS